MTEHEKQLLAIATQLVEGNITTYEFLTKTIRYYHLNITAIEADSKALDALTAEELG